MKRDTSDDRLKPEADERLDHLVDEALREASAQTPGSAVKARVMAAWDAHHASAEGRADAPGPRWWTMPALLRPAATLAGALAIVLGVFFAWQHVNRQFDAVERHQTSRTAARTQPPREVPPRQAVEPHAEAAATVVQPESPSSRPRRSRYITVEWPVEQVAEAGPHLPGAPAGDLGDPIAPMAGPPPISIAPIETAPSISEIARPVTEFPADNQPPAGEGADPGKSGGPRR